MNFNTELLQERNKLYKNKNPIVLKILGAILYLYIFILICMLIFSTIFIFNLAIFTYFIVN